jgi:hypothetical protein
MPSRQELFWVLTRVAREGTMPKPSWVQRRIEERRAEREAAGPKPPHPPPLPTRSIPELCVKHRMVLPLFARLARLGPTPPRSGYVRYSIRTLHVHWTQLAHMRDLIVDAGHEAALLRVAQIATSESAPTAEELAELAAAIDKLMRVDGL